MNLDREDLKPCKTTLIRFDVEHSPPKGYIDLKLTLGTKQAFKSKQVRFIASNFPSPYNIILGRPTIHNWDMLVSTKHQKLKIVGSKNKVITVNRDQKESQQCYFEPVKEGEGRPKSPPQIHKGDKSVKKGESREQGRPVNMMELDMHKEAENL